MEAIVLDAVCVTETEHEGDEEEGAEKTSRLRKGIDGGNGRQRGSKL